MFAQKFLTEGVVSNTSYSMLKSPLSDPWLYEGISRGAFNWLQNSSLWIEASIGIGGVSGSGIYALGGSEKGKVIALRNMGMATSVAINTNISTNKEGLDIKGLGIVADDDTLITVMAKENGEKLFSNFSYKDAKFDMTMEDFEKKEPSIKVTKLCGGRVSVSGMNGAIPINSVKMFLETRGIDPNYFGWELAPESYWEK